MHEAEYVVDITVVDRQPRMTGLEKPMFDAFAGRVLNTHPALLPSLYRDVMNGTRPALAPL